MTKNTGMMISSKFPIVKTQIHKHTMNVTSAYRHIISLSLVLFRLSFLFSSISSSKCSDASELNGYSAVEQHIYSKSVQIGQSGTTYDKYTNNNTELQTLSTEHDT